MKNIIKNVKEKVNMTTLRATTAVAAGMAAIIPGFSTDANGAAGKVVDMVFNLIQMGGLVLLALGVIQLVRAVIALTGGDQLQPGQLGKALGMIIAGIVAAALKSLLGLLGISTSVKLV